MGMAWEGGQNSLTCHSLVAVKTQKEQWRGKYETVLGQKAGSKFSQTRLQNACNAVGLQGTHLRSCKQTKVHYA